MGLLGDDRYAMQAASLIGMAPFADLEPREIGEFLIRISPSVLRQQDRPFTLDWVQANRYVPHEALTAGLDMLSGWPDAFYAVIGKKHVNYDFIDTRQVSRFLEAIEFWLSKKVSEGRGLLIAAAVRAYRSECQSRPDVRPFVNIKPLKIKHRS